MNTSAMAASSIRELRELASSTVPPSGRGVKSYRESRQSATPSGCALAVCTIWRSRQQTLTHVTADDHTGTVAISAAGMQRDGAPCSARPITVVGCGTSRGTAHP